VAVTDGIAVLSGCAQAAAYAYYVHLAVRGSTWPNPMSWLMFAYGTALVVLIEAHSGATWRELTLPVVCAASSVAIAIMAWRKRGAAASLTKIDWLVFRADIALTVAYVIAWLLANSGTLSAGGFAATNVVFLIGVNATTFTSFVPLFLSALRDPKTEHPGPWMLWSFAYLMLLVATALNAKGVGAALLLIYPAINFILHSDVAALVFPEQEKRHG
jgi:hypothetical protein